MNQLPIRNALILIDIQEKIIKQIDKKDLIIQNIKKLLNAYQILDENVFLSEQNPFKLGPTIPELIPRVSFIKIEKMDFSICKTEEFIKELVKKKITSLIVCGIETHICIQQSVIELLKKGYEVLLISDAMGSRQNSDHEIALKRMTNRGAVLTTTESIIFELCETANRKEFKEISNIIKNQQN